MSPHSCSTDILLHILAACALFCNQDKRGGMRRVILVQNPEVYFKQGTSMRCVHRKKSLPYWGADLLLWPKSQLQGPQQKEVSASSCSDEGWIELPSSVLSSKTSVETKDVHDITQLQGKSFMTIQAKRKCALSERFIVWDVFYVHFGMIFVDFWRS